MKVLDTSFLIDYLDGDPATRDFYERNGGADVRWMLPTPALAEILVGEGNLPNGDVDGVRTDLAWTDVYAVDERTTITAGEIAAEIGPEGRFLTDRMHSSQRPAANSMRPSSPPILI